MLQPLWFERYDEQKRILEVTNSSSFKSDTASKRETGRVNAWTKERFLDMSATLFGKVSVCLAYHPRKTYAVRLDCRQFYISNQFPVLFANAGSMEVEIHAAQLPDEPLQTFRGIVFRYVDALNGGCT